MRFRRVLVRLDDEPPLVARTGQSFQYGSEIDRPVAGHGEYVAEHRIEKAHVALPRLHELGLANVLAVHVHDALRMALERAQRIAAGKGEVPRVEQQAD